MVPKNLGKLLNKNLAGFKLAKGYYLELIHGLWGMFPAVFKGTKNIVLCLDKNLLEEVWNQLPKRQARVNEILLLVNSGEYYGFSIQNENGVATEPMHILFKKECKSLIRDKKNPFEWAPGLLRLTDEGNVRSPFEKSASF